MANTVNSASIATAHLDGHLVPEGDKPVLTNGFVVATVLLDDHIERL